LEAVEVTARDCALVLAIMAGMAHTRRADTTIPATTVQAVLDSIRDLAGGAPVIMAVASMAAAFTAGAVFGDSNSAGYRMLAVSDCGGWLRTGV